MASDAGKALFHKQLEEIAEQVGISKQEAFPRWLCQNILGITDEGKIDEVVSIGGKGNYGINIFHADEDGDVTEQYVCWMQAKFSDDLDRKITRDEMESFGNTLGHLRDCPKQANRIFKQKSAEFVKIDERYPGIKKRMIYAVAGRLDDQARELVSNPRWIEERLGCRPGSNSPIEILELDDILSCMITPHTPTMKITFDGDALERTDTTTGKKSIIGYVRADLLVKLAQDHKETLFLENPRQALGKTAPTHKAILNTLSDPNSRKKFWKLNNGITAICTGFNNTDDSATYSIDNFKIVNGRQTTYTLENSADPVDEASLLMIIHEVADDKERNQISETTNTQNPVKPIDLITNYPEMTELELQCKMQFPEFYFERQTKGFKFENRTTQQRVTCRRLMEKSSTAKALLRICDRPQRCHDI